MLDVRNNFNEGQLFMVQSIYQYGDKTFKIQHCLNTSNERDVEFCDVSGTLPVSLDS